MGLADRLLTIVVTVTVTSVAWILAAGTGLVSTANDGESGFGGILTAQAVETSAGGELLIPVAGVQAAALSNSFRDTRAAGGRSHEAIDIMAPRGTPVLAAAPGTVERMFRSDEGGNTIYLRSSDRRVIYYYAHLDRYAPGLAEGQSIALGQPLGTVGATGNAQADDPHLHFAMMRTIPEARWSDPGTAINPYPLLVRNR